MTSLLLGKSCVFPSNQWRIAILCEFCPYIIHFPENLLFPKFSSASLNLFNSVQSLSHVQLCDLMDCSTPGLSVHYQLPEFTQTHVHWVGDAIQPSHPLSPPSPPAAFSLSQHQGLFLWVSFSHQVAKVLDFQLQHQSFQCIIRTDLL